MNTAVRIQAFPLSLSVEPKPPHMHWTKRDASADPFDVFQERAELQILRSLPRHLGRQLLSQRM